MLVARVLVAKVPVRQLRQRPRHSVLLLRLSYRRGDHNRSCGTAAAPHADMEPQVRHGRPQMRYQEHRRQ